MARVRECRGRVGLREALAGKYRALVERYAVCPCPWHGLLASLEAGEAVTVQGWQLPEGYRVGSDRQYEWFTLDAAGVLTPGCSPVVRELAV